MNNMIVGAAAWRRTVARGLLDQSGNRQEGTDAGRRGAGALDRRAELRADAPVGGRRLRDGSGAHGYVQGVGQRAGRRQRPQVAVRIHGPEQLDSECLGVARRQDRGQSRPADRS